MEKELGGGGSQRKYIYIFKAKERKQYQNNGTENLFVFVMYLIETYEIIIDSREC